MSSHLVILQIYNWCLGKEWANMLCPCGAKNFDKRFLQEHPIPTSNLTNFASYSKKSVLRNKSEAIAIFLGEMADNEYILQDRHVHRNVDVEGTHQEKNIIEQIRSHS